MLKRLCLLSGMFVALSLSEISAAAQIDQQRATKPPNAAKPPLKFVDAATVPSGGVNGTFVAIADLNRDGKQDMIVGDECASEGCTTGGAVSILLGNGDGTFQAAVPYSSGGFGNVSIAIADVNGDGLLDLVVANQLGCQGCDGGGVSVLLGNGDGTFQSPVVQSSGETPLSVAVADIDGNGTPDIVVADLCVGDCPAVFILLGNGDGTFQAPIPLLMGTAYADSVAVGDVNGDGKPDLVVTAWCDVFNSQGNCQHYYDGTITVLLNEGGGSFYTSATYDSGGLYAQQVRIADMNADGKPDLVVANECADVEGLGSCSSGTVSVLFDRNPNDPDSTRKFQELGSLDLCKASPLA